MGAEEYELLVSTLDKLPILNEKLSLEREKYDKANQRIFSLKEQIDGLENELKTRDSKIHEIDFEMEEIDSQVKKLDLEITDLKDSITIEEKKVEPYIQAQTRAVKRVNNAKKSFWNEDENRIMIFSALGIGLLFYLWVSSDEFSMGPCCIALIWPVAVIFLYETNFGGNSYITKSAIRKKDEVKKDLQKASGRLHGLKSKIGTKKKKRNSLDYQVRIHKTEKERLIGLEKDLMKMNKELFELEASASFLSKEVESLVKEIHDGQNAIAPLIPYSDLLSDDGFL